MANIEVTRNKISTEFVTTSADENAHAAAVAYADEFAQTPAEHAEAVKSILFVLKLSSRGMTTAMNETVRLDDRLELGLSNDRGLTAGREQARADVTDELDETRDIFESIGGHEAVVDANLADPTPHSGPELVRAALQAADAIEKVTERIGKRGIVLKSSEYARPLREKATRLDELLKTSTEDLRKDQALRAERDVALEKSQRRFMRGARLIEALLRVAGLEALADRVRPSTRRPGNTIENDATGPVPQSAEPAA